MVKRFSTDVVMKSTWLHILEDLKNLSPLAGGFSECKKLLLADDISGFRDALASVSLPFWSDPLDFKVVYQLKSFLDRYLFVRDKFSPDELAEASWLKYQSVQARLSTPIDVPKLYRAGLVRKWRLLCKEILGQYDEEEHWQNCQFARNATVGHTRRRSRLDHKLKGPITGSYEHLAFLRRCCEEDPLLSHTLTGVRFKAVRTLKLTFVPKSFKALRAIMPDTLAGSFYSKGLGEMIATRLRRRGLDIDRLQDQHRKLAQRASAYRGRELRRLATLDLSSASDSISMQLLRLILPVEWYNKIRFGRVPYYTYSGAEYRLQSACTMGLGHTFPLETLLFYVLVRGIAETVRPHCDLTLSCYGDDLILPTWLVKPVVAVFKELKLMVNEEKSFWGLCDFRESCGGDYFRGLDVRPSRPEETGRKMARREFVAFCYALANSLLQRWKIGSLERTITFLARVILALDGFVLAVPSSFPDQSGLKVDPGILWTEQPETVNFGSLRIKYWRSSVPLSRVTWEDPFAWAALQASYGSLPARTFLDWCRDQEDRSPGSLVLRKRKRGGRWQYIGTFAPDPGREESWPENPSSTVCLKWD